MINFRTQADSYLNIFIMLLNHVSRNCGCKVRCSLRYFTRLISTSRSGSEIDLEKLNNVFDNANKSRVIKKLKAAKPIQRPDILTSGREAGILVPMCLINEEPSILFMVRSLHLTSHRGEICFPGGMQDRDDKDLVHTALRETEEEIGLDDSLVDVWGTLPALPSRQGGNKVTPVLGYCNIQDICDLRLNQAEVESVFTRTIASICDPANHRQTQWRVPGSKGFTMPVFTGGEHKIWGLTSVVLHQIMTVLAPELYQFKLRHRS